LDLALRDIETLICNAQNPQVRTGFEKSRLKDNDMSFPIKKFGSEFVVFVKLNCGKRIKGRMFYDYKKDPEFYIFPTELCKKYNRRGDWFKVHIRDIPNYEKYKNNWKLIKDKLGI